MKRAWLVGPLMAMLAVASAPLSAQQPDSSGPEESDAPALRAQIRQRWHEHIRQNLGLTDEQAGKVQATEDRFERQRVQYRGQLRDINRQITGESLSESPNNERMNALLQQRQDTKLRLAQVDRDEDTEMAGYLSPMQRVRYQRERQVLRERIAEMVRHRRARGLGPGPRRGEGGGGGGGAGGRRGQGRRRPQP